MPALTIGIGGVPASIASSALEQAVRGGIRIAGERKASGEREVRREAGGRDEAVLGADLVGDRRDGRARAGVGAQEDAVAGGVVARGRDHRTPRARRTRTLTRPPSESTLASQSAGRAV